MLAFNPDRRPTMADVLKHPYFTGIANPKREPSAAPIEPVEFAFETEQLTNLDIKELIYREILEYHPKAKEEYYKRYVLVLMVFLGLDPFFKLGLECCEG